MKRRGRVISKNRLKRKRYRLPFSRLRRKKKKNWRRRKLRRKRDLRRSKLIEICQRLSSNSEWNNS